jgi:hypothetical protein
MDSLYDLPHLFVKELGDTLLVKGTRDVCIGEAFSANESHAIPFPFLLDAACR